MRSWIGWYPERLLQNEWKSTINQNAFKSKARDTTDFQRGLVDKEEYYDVCDVTLSVYPQRESLKNMPGHGGNLT
jgi:hypothetical protein